MKDRDFRNQGQYQRHSEEIQKLIKKIREGQSLASVLKPEEFAKPGGYAEKIVEELRNKLKTSQLRKIFTEIKNICEVQIKKPDSSKVEIYLLYPKLAYSMGRGLMPEDFYNLMEACLNKLENGSKEDFERFLQFITAIVAYNKKYDR
ncbi:type III-A CRISPR-associated protein Csm2 [Sulfurihydrogenibium sp.]|uniref:type III-A CRISPR-associated protein Csm2 n=1 Tax=Sulfurihydrogenibium sp. TaxID=2053621 RepID=UPI000CAC2145|nr:MAG: type III-A CRISPR-associated protein Csm2 [Sulfurihydrogenibium sp.]